MKSLRPIFIAGITLLFAISLYSQAIRSHIGKEVAIPVHLQDGEEYQIPISELIAYGRRLFTAMCKPGKKRYQKNKTTSRLSPVFCHRFSHRFSLLDRQQVGPLGNPAEPEKAYL